MDVFVFDLAKASTELAAGDAIVRPDGTFQYYAPLSFFEKADAPEGQRRRFGGVATTEEKDQEGETILQRGLDWSHFLARGWFNDNHSSKTGGVVGYPTGVAFYKKGEALPDGTSAHANLHWSEGYLLDGVPAAEDIWRAGMALQRAGNPRRLGQSIEGRITKRSGPEGKIIARAEVHNDAITHCPVNAGTSLSFLAKALITLEDILADEGLGDPAAKTDDAAKALTATTGPAASLPAGQSVSTLGPVTGAGAGRILTPQSLERDPKRETYGKSLTVPEQFAVVHARYPRLSAATCGRLLDTIHALRARA